MQSSRLLLRIIPRKPNFRLSRRLISTSSKNKETIAIAEVVLRKKPIVINNEFKDDWISYGFSNVNERLDRFYMHVVMFCSVTIGLVLSAFILTYQPDLKARDWIHRQAYLELYRREKHGLPLVNRELVDPATIVLPTDEELGYTDIII